MRPLVPVCDRRVAAGLLLLAVATVAALGAWVHGGGSTALDDWAFREFDAHLGPTTRSIAIAFSLPWVSALFALLLVVRAARARAWNLAALAALTPVVTVLVSEFVLKPLVDRHLYLGVAFPSGHESGVAGWVSVAVLMAAREPLRAGPRVFAAVVLVGYACVGAIGLTADHYHYLTDTLGAIGVAVVVVLVLAFALDAVTARLRSPSDEAQPAQLT